MPTIQAQIPHPYVPQVSSAATQGALAIYGRSVEESLRRLETSINAITTSDIPEGSNLYYTDARARAALSATSPITYNSGTGAIGANAASANTFNYLVQRDGSGGFLAGAVTVTNLTDSALTPGSVVFAGAGGLLSQDNASFFFDDTNNRLGIRTVAPQDALHVFAAGLTYAPGIIVSDTTALAAGVGGGISFRGYYVGSSETTGGLFKCTKLNGTSNNWAFALDFYSRENGSSDVALALRLDDFRNAMLIGSLSVARSTTVPTAFIHVGASTGVASTAPLKFTSGTLLGAVENGALEYDGAKLYLTAAGVRSQLTTGAAYVHPNHSGDVTSVADGATTIANNAVTNAKAADMAANSIKGNNTGGAADPLDLTAAQTRTLLNVADGATANSSDATLLARANHTGTQLAATISDFSTAVAATAAVTANTAKVTNATHTGEVTGATALTITADAVTYAKMQNVSAISKLIGRGSAAGVGDPEEITLGTNLSMSGTTLNAAAGGAASATTVEVALGAVNFAGSFTITDAAITSGSKILCWQAPGPYTGKGTRADEASMQAVAVIAVEPAAGTARVSWQTPPLAAMRRATVGALDTTWMAVRLGRAGGNVKFSYMVLS